MRPFLFAYESYGRFTLRFHMSIPVDRLPAVDMETESGAMRVATAEPTAWREGAAGNVPDGRWHDLQNAELEVDL